MNLQICLYFTKSHKSRDHVISSIMESMLLFFRVGTKQNKKALSSRLNNLRLKTENDKSSKIVIRK